MKKSCFVMLTFAVALCALTVPAVAMDVDELIEAAQRVRAGERP